MGAIIAFVAFILFISVVPALPDPKVRRGLLIGGVPTVVVLWAAAYFLH